MNAVIRDLDTGSVISALYTTSKPHQSQRASVLIFHPDHRIICQSVMLRNAKVSSFRNELKASPCLNKRIYLATLAELANDTSDSVIPMILQPSHNGWHQKLFSLFITFYRVKRLKKLYPGSVRVPRDGMNALGSRYSTDLGPTTL